MAAWNRIFFFFFKFRYVLYISLFVRVLYCFLLWPLPTLKKYTFFLLVIISARDDYESILYFLYFKERTVLCRIYFDYILRFPLMCRICRISPMRISFQRVYIENYIMFIKYHSQWVSFGRRCFPLHFKLINTYRLQVFIDIFIEIRD